MVFRDGTDTDAFHGESQDIVLSLPTLFGGEHSGEEWVLAAL